MSWIYLILAGFGEIGFVLFMKLSDGFKNKRYTVLTCIAAFISFYFLSKSLLEIPIGTGYAIWTGIGAAGSVLIGMLLFGESRDGKRVLFIVMIIAGVVGLKLVG